MGFFSKIINEKSKHGLNLVYLQSIYSSVVINGDRIIKHYFVDDLGNEHIKTEREPRSKCETLLYAQDPHALLLQID
jgi:hypothetical protein